MDKKTKDYIIVFLGLLILYVPLFVVVLFSFNNSNYIFQWKGFTTKWYIEAVNNPEYSEPLLNSITLAFSSLFLTLLLSIPYLLFSKKTNLFFQKTIKILLIVQVIIPEIIMGISLAIFFYLLNIKLNFITILIAHTTFSIGFFSLSFLSQPIYSFLPKIKKVSFDLGGNKLFTFKKLILPLIIKPLLASSFLVLALSLDNFIISFFTSGIKSKTVPILLFNSIKHGIEPALNASVVIILTFSILLIIISSIFFNKNKYYDTINKKQ